MAPGRPGTLRRPHVPLENWLVATIISSRIGRVLTNGAPPTSPQTAEQSSTEFAAMADKLKIRPLHDRVIIQRLDAETRSPGGIV
ncbi:MAG: hypothetical protein KA506_14840, partial [Steroidobacteraceae bacterium]|nr:hypothetical protein [Steroidobacteraceae bacterium]